MSSFTLSFTRCSLTFERPVCATFNVVSLPSCLYEFTLIERKLRLLLNTGGILLIHISMTGAWALDAYFKFSFRFLDKATDPLDTHLQHVSFLLSINRHFPHNGCSLWSIWSPPFEIHHVRIYIGKPFSQTRKFFSCLGNFNRTTFTYIKKKNTKDNLLEDVTKDIAEITAF